MGDELGSRNKEMLCFLVMIVFSGVTYYNQEIIPLQLSVTVFSVAIIIIGSYKSLYEIISEMKKVHILKSKEQSKVETVSKSDALQFPFVAGGVLVGLYVLIKYFGKEVVNQVLLGYIAIGSTTGIKALITSFIPSLNSLDEKKIVDVDIKILQIQITPLDVICFFPSCLSVAFYVYSKSWIYNNILAIVFCVHALQFMFLGNFQTGALLLGLLFFYDIFFVFGTDVMVTVATSIDAPIKLQFPKDLSADPPKYSILGLGDIVIPGIFVSLCLRFDFLKCLNKRRFEDIFEKEKKGQVKTNATVQYLLETARNAPKHYFIACLIGYLIAIIATVIIMIIFQHGQPALLYLVPGCLLSVTITALMKGELGMVWNFSEDEFIKSKEQKTD